MALQIAIVGGGISGLACGYFLRARAPELKLTVLEAEPVAGGKVRTSCARGFTFDWGPNGFLAAPKTQALAQQLGLTPLPASSAARRRYVFCDGALRALPDSPLTLLTSELLSPAGKLRALAELALGRRHRAEETVYDFVARHFGAEVARRFAELIVSGVAAGDPRALSVDALFPRLRALEARHGSLLRGLLAQRPSGSRLMSFAGGMGQLSSALSRALGSALRTGARVVALSQQGTSYRLTLADGEQMSADSVVLATPAYVSAELLAPLLPEAAALLRSIPYADVSVWGLGYHRAQVPQLLDGFGFLAPRSEGLSSLGVLWSNAIFSDQAPLQRVMLRAIAGAPLAKEPLEVQLRAIRDDLRRSMGITAEPEFIEHALWPRGIPQYTLGHSARIGELMAKLPPRLLLTGNAYFGIGVNDCVRDAERVAQALLTTAQLPTATSLP